MSVAASGAAFLKPDARLARCHARPPGHNHLLVVLSNGFARLRHHSCRLKGYASESFRPNQANELLREKVFCLPRPNDVAGRLRDSYTQWRTSGSGTLMPWIQRTENPAKLTPCRSHVASNDSSSGGDKHMNIFFRRDALRQAITLIPSCGLFRTEAGPAAPVSANSQRAA